MKKSREIKIKIKERNAEKIFLALLFLFLVMWVGVQPFNTSPDEQMRYQVVEYLSKYMKLPHGGDPLLRDPNWGISYAFNPILAYMVMAIPVKIVSIFTDSVQVLVVAARMINVCFGCVTAWIVLRIGDYFFEKYQRWMFVVLAMLMPGTLFVFSYVNTDGLAILSTALIFLGWVKGLKEGWTKKNCALLAVGLSLCFLSYYNAYGMILLSVPLFVIDIFADDDSTWKDKFACMMKRGLLILGITAVLAGWWFVRSYIIYDGDILGMKTSSMYAAKYAVDQFKPENRFVFSAMDNASIWQMFIFVPGAWYHNWLLTVAVSFVGTFGYMTVFMPYWLSKCYFAVYAVGIIGILSEIKNTFFLRQRKTVFLKKKVGETVWNMRVTQVHGFSKNSLLHINLAFATVIPFVLLVYYSYFSDFQAQGRYILPGLLPIMYFVTLGVGNLLERWVQDEKIRKIIYGILTILLTIGAIGTYCFVFYPYYSSL